MNDTIRGLGLRVRRSAKPEMPVDDQGMVEKTHSQEEMEQMETQETAAEEKVQQNEDAAFAGRMRQAFEEGAQDSSQERGPIQDPHWYNWHPVASCDQIAEHFPSNLGKAIEYIYRSPFKGDPVHDIEWAIRFLRREQARIREQGFADLQSGSVEAVAELVLLRKEPRL